MGWRATTARGKMTLGVRAQGAAGAGGAAEAAAACGEAAAAGVGEVELGGYFGSLFSCLC